MSATQVVYFVSSMDMSRIKIGTSRDADRRLIDLLRSGPEQLLLVGVVAGHRNVEAALHVRFGATRLHGEWFLASEELDDVIRQVQSIGPRWSAEHYPLHLRADGIEWSGDAARGLCGTGRYSARARLFASGFRSAPRSVRALTQGALS